MNTEDSLNRSSIQNGSMLSYETVEEMRAKFMKHQQIYKTNYDQAESEIKRMDELYHDLIENVLKVTLMHTFCNHDRETLLMSYGV